jgi:aryl-alcohol dehydrogenase-like predicted oxidoreductase
MKYNQLGRSGITVSRICLGTMTFGEQNSEEDAFRQLDRAVDAGVNFIDTAEMYPIPPRAETCGRTEEIVGRWINSRGNRDAVVLATKISGPGWDHIRGGDGRFGRKQIREALDGNLRRLGTDHVDLYQLHWPDRKTNAFGRRGYTHDDSAAFTPLAEVLDALSEQIEAGRIRTVGVSNETPWGVMGYLGLAEKDGLPRIASIQNPYSLLNRLFEVGLAEVAIREDCGLLAYSPLAMGTLSGKYLDGGKPPGARLTLFTHYQRYTKPPAIAATEAYVALARRHGLDPAQMALAYVNSRRFLTSTIIGATTIEQLESNLAAEDLTLDREVVDGIEAIHENNPDPAP